MFYGFMVEQTACYNAVETDSWILYCVDLELAVFLKIGLVQCWLASLKKPSRK